MRYDSCRQCTKRRIKCDKSTPQCFKCVKRGLECSGVGKKYHFVEDYTSRVVKASSLSHGPSYRERLQQGDRIKLNDGPHKSWKEVQATLDEGRDRSTEGGDEHCEVEATVVSPSCLGVPHADTATAIQPLLQAFSLTSLVQEATPPLISSLQTHRPEQMMLFDHCKY